MPLELRAYFLLGPDLVTRIRSSGNPAWRVGARLAWSPVPAPLALVLYALSMLRIDSTYLPQFLG